MAGQAIMIRTLIRAMRRAHRAAIRANRAVEPDQRSMQLANLGSNMIIMGAISTAVTIFAIIPPPERISANPTYMHVILLVVLGFIFLAGLAGITVGMFLLSMNNPGRYRHVAMVMLWTSCVAAALATGILLVASFSLP